MPLPRAGTGIVRRSVKAAAALLQYVLAAPVVCEQQQAPSLAPAQAHRLKARVHLAPTRLLSSSSVGQKDAMPGSSYGAAAAAAEHNQGPTPSGKSSRPTSGGGSNAAAVATLAERDQGPVADMQQQQQLQPYAGCLMSGGAGQHCEPVRWPALLSSGRGVVTPIRREDGVAIPAAALHRKRGRAASMEQPLLPKASCLAPSSRLMSSQGPPVQVMDVQTLLEYTRELVGRLGQETAAKDEAERRHREDEGRIQELEGRLAEEAVDTEEAALCRRRGKAQLRVLEARVANEVAGRENAERRCREGAGKLQKLEDRLAKEIAAREAVQQSFGEASTRNEGLVGQMEERGRQHDTVLTELWGRNTVLEAELGEALAAHEGARKCLGEEVARIKVLEGQLAEAEKVGEAAERRLAEAKKALADDVAVRMEAERQLVVVAEALEREVAAKERAQSRLSVATDALEREATAERMAEHQLVISAEMLGAETAAKAEAQRQYSEAAAQQALRLCEEKEVARAEVAGLKQVVREQRALMHRLDRTNTRLWAHCAEEGLKRVGAIIGNVWQGGVWASQETSKGFMLRNVWHGVKRPPQKIGMYRLYADPVLYYLHAATYSH